MDEKEKEDMIRRLREPARDEKELHDVYLEGQGAGQRWAKHDASREGLERLSSFHTTTTPQDVMLASQGIVDESWKDDSETVAKVASGMRGVAFWRIALNRPDWAGSIMKSRFVRGFVDGALSAWDEVKHEVNQA